MIRKQFSFSGLAGAKLVAYLEENHCGFGGCGLTSRCGITHYPNPDSLGAKLSETVALSKDVFSST